jgi:AcrR family transcriptional regulator
MITNRGEQRLSETLETLRAKEMPRAVKKRQNTRVRQKQIVNAVRKLITKYGSEHITVRRIAKEIGISEGAIYRHFKSKRDILFLLVDDIEHNLMEEIDKSYAESAGRLRILDNMLRNHLSSIEQRKGLSFHVIAEIVSLGDRRLNRKIFEILNKYFDRIKQVLSEGIKTSEIRADIDLDTTATLFFGMIQGLVTIWTLSHYQFSLERKYVPLWNLMREAIGAH